MFGKKKRIIAEQNERIQALEKQLETLSADNKRLKDRIIDVERRERGIGRALNEATATADNMIADAQRKSAVILDQMQAECESQRKKAERIVDDAYRNAREIVREAEDEGEKKRGDMQKQIEQYAALLNGYDAMVQEQLQMAQDSAKRFAELSRALHESVPKLLGADGAPLPGLAGSEPETKDDPAYLREDPPDYQANPLRYEPNHDGGSGDEQLWTVDKITATGSDGAGTDVDSIIDEILAAAEDEQ